MRIEIYRPHPDNPDAFSLLTWDSGLDSPIALVRLGQDMRASRPGTFALILRIDGTEETVLERWRVSADGRILRARFSALEPELEQT